MKDHDDHDQAVIDAYEELTGLDWNTAQHSISGCYFGQGTWVSGKAIAQALKDVADYYDDPEPTTFGDIRDSRDKETGIES